MWSTQADLRLELLLPSEPFFLPSSLPFPFLPSFAFVFLSLRFSWRGQVSLCKGEEKRVSLSLPPFLSFPPYPSLFALFLRLCVGCNPSFLSFISTSDHISASRSQLPTRCGQSRSSRHGWGWCARGASRSCLQIANCLLGR